MQRILASTVVITTGTFLSGEIFIGLETRSAGRIGDKASIGLAQTLRRLQFRVSRLRTGTPPRIALSTVDFDALIEQSGDMPPEPFSFLNDRVAIAPEEQMPTHLTHTSRQTHELCIQHMHENTHALTRDVHGPRYCPSLESKVRTFGDRVHQVGFGLLCVSHFNPFIADLVGT